MKHVYLKTVIALVMTMFLPSVAGAITFVADGVAYSTLSDSTVAVVSSNSVDYSGDVVIPATVTNDGVTYVVTKINTYAFNNRSNLNSVTFPPTIEVMEYEAFSGCDNLRAVYVSDLAAWVNIDFSYSGNPLLYAHHLYVNDVKVRDLVIPESVTTIKKYAFLGCTEIRTLTIPANVTDIDYSAFYMCGGMTSIQVDEGNPVYDSRDNCNAVIKTNSRSLWIGCKNTVIPESVTSIGYCAFSGCTELTSVNLHSGIYNIGNMAFEGCTGLTEVNLPVNTTYVGSAAFRGCTGLTEMIIPNGVYNIGSCAFMDCVNLSHVQLSSNLKKLDNAVFKNCTSLTDIVIPDKVETIVNSCFYGCSSLETVEFGNSLKVIEGFAFAYCTSLKSIELPASLEQLIQAAFNSCTALTEFTINGTSLMIDNYVVEDCESLTELYIPECVAQIKPMAFIRVPNVTHVSVAPSNTVYDSRDNCNAIIETESNTLISGFTSTVVPKTVTSLGHGAFAYVKGLSEMVLPKSVKSISTDAFEYSDVKSLSLPGVETLEDYAFYSCKELTDLVLGRNISSIGTYPLLYCSKIKSLTCMANVPPVLSGDLCTEGGFYYFTTLKVPESAVEAYKAADYWKKFRNIVGLPDIEAGDANGDGVLSINDVSTLINGLLSGSSDVINDPQADVNGDGKVSITDIAALISLLLSM